MPGGSMQSGTLPLVHTSLFRALAGVMGFHDIPPSLIGITARLVEIVLANQKVKAFHFLYYGA